MDDERARLLHDLAMAKNATAKAKTYIDKHFGTETKYDKIDLWIYKADSLLRDAHRALFFMWTEEE